MNTTEHSGADVTPPPPLNGLRARSPDYTLAHANIIITTMTLLTGIGYKRISTARLQLGLATWPHNHSDDEHTRDMGGNSATAHDE